MKRNIITLLLVVFAMTQTMAQTYDNLWKQAGNLQKKDQPRSEIAIMQKIVKKATLQKDYGQLLAAEMRQAMLWQAISPDSLAPAIARIERQAEQTKDPMLRAVWYAALGKVYREHTNELKSAEYFKKALAQPELLAKHYSTEYAPLTLKGMDGATFNNDMLHLIGFEADTKEAYQLMHAYYNKVGNRGAACLCAFEIIQKDRYEDTKEVRKSKYLNTIDSLIAVYQDVPEAGELAVEHFRFMQGATDAKVGDKLNYINYALNRWGGWSRMNVLRNVQKRLTEPMFEILDFPTVTRPNLQQWLKVRTRNVQNMKVTISRLNITADNDYDVNDKETYKMLLKKTSSLHQKDLNKQFYGHPNYEIVRDSILIAGLPLGAYLIEVSIDNASIAPQRALFYVSDLALMAQQLPDDSHRYVVVSATSGQPIAGATVLLYEENYVRRVKGKRVAHARLTTDENGEASFKNVDGSILISTATDKYTPARYTYLTRTRYYEQKEDRHCINLYTDRAIYRPGQTVHVSSVFFINLKGEDAKVDDSRKEIKYTLYDTNNKVMSEKTTKMDEYGTASVDFELPQGGLTGTYRINTSLGGYYRFQVEEYKRPTFEITFPKVNQRYTWGDTVVVKATAKTYAGVPVQGARVSYQVTRRSQLWWWGSRVADQVVFNGTGTTRDDGTFYVEIPLEPSVSSKDAQGVSDFMRKARFFNFDVSATVTDASGESQEGEMSLPLGTKPTAFSVNLPHRIETDSLKQVTFSYRNSGGIEIAAQVRYRIDKGEWQNVAANTPVNIKEYAGGIQMGDGKQKNDVWKTGVHELEAICGQDTLSQKFVLFSMNDTHPMEPTKHWSYQTTTVFPRDGKPAYIQVGSSENGVHIVYSVIAGNKLIEKGAWELGDSIVTLPFVYKDEYASGIVLNYSFVKEGVCYAGTMRIAKPLPEKQLNITWKTFRNRLTPGQKEEWTLRITTPDGKPAKAQLMSVLYDKSLDQFVGHSWDLSLGLYRMMPNCYWTHNLRFAPFGLRASYPTKYYDENELEVDKLNREYFREVNPAFMMAYELGALSEQTVETARNEVNIEKHSLVKDEAKMYKNAARSNIAVAAPAPMASAAMEDRMMADAASDDDGRNTKGTAVNDAEFDQVQARENLNETAFFYPALKSDNNGNVAIKFTLPESLTAWKFMGLAHDKEMRNGLLVDEAVAKKTVMVQPNMPRFLREGDKATIVAKVFNTSDKKVSGNARMQLIDPETNRVIWQKNQKYSIDANGNATLSFDIEGLKEGVYINKVVAAGNGYSDGEQHYLPVLSNRELVTNTLPFTLTEKGSKNLDLGKLYLDKDGKSLMGKDGKLTKSVADAKITIEYANNPSWLMIQALPTVSNPADDNAISLMTAIYSNSIVRHIMKSSPVIKQVVEVWKQEKVSSDSNQKGSSSLASQLEKNQELKNLVLNETPWMMDADKESEQKAKLISYFDETQNASRLASQVAKLKTLQRKDGAFAWWKGMPGSRCMTTAVAKMMVRLNQMIGMQSEISSMLSASLNFLQKETAKEVSEMKKEERKAKTAFDKAEEGSKARKEVEATLASIRPSEEAMGVDAKQTIADMKLWLLQSKRTQAWDTPINTVDAVYAFMNGNAQVLDKTSENATILLDGKPQTLPKATAGLGYVKVSKNGVAKTFTVEKKNEGTSWGAVYAQFTQPSTEVTSSESGIKVKIILTITADRDYDFVQIVDKRAACLEPLNQLSGYQWDLGCYVSPKDNATNFYFDRLSKGKHIVEMEYYVDRKGEYQAGSCAAQCAYSPEYGGRAEAYKLKIDN